MRIEKFINCQDHTGERPYWDAETSAFYWIDVFGQRIHRRNADGEIQTWSVPSLIGSLALINPGYALVSLHNGIFIFEFKSGRSELVGFPDPGVAGNLRLNDGKVDPAGRFVCGGADYFRSQPIAGLYSVDSCLGMKRLGGEIIVANGLAWSPDGSWFYFADSFRHTIYRAAYDLQSGTVGTPNPFAHFSTDEGMPDGACIDVEGYLWVAMVYGGKLVRLCPDGTRDCEVLMPVSAPTSVAFGGPAMDRLFVTSKSRDSKGNELDPGLGGSVFVVDGLPTRGSAEKRFDCTDSLLIIGSNLLTNKKA